MSTASNLQQPTQTKSAKDFVMAALVVLLLALAYLAFSLSNEVKATRQERDEAQKTVKELRTQLEALRPAVQQTSTTIERGAKLGERVIGIGEKGMDLIFGPEPTTDKNKK